MAFKLPLIDQWLTAVMTCTRTQYVYNWWRHSRKTLCEGGAKSGGTFAFHSVSLIRVNTTPLALQAGPSRRNATQALTGAHSNCHTPLARARAVQASTFSCSWRYARSLVTSVVAGAASLIEKPPTFLSVLILGAAFLIDRPLCLWCLRRASPWGTRGLAVISLLVIASLHFGIYAHVHLPLD